MNTLFPIETFLPQGLQYFPGFITASEEMTLLEEISKLDLSPMKFHAYEAKRKTAGFGYDWSFESRTLSKGTPIPPAFNFLLDKVARQMSIEPPGFGAMLVTEYPVGSVINWHRDAPPFDVIAGVSLLSDCSFRFRPYDKARQDRKSIISIPLERRSLYIMAGESRSEWEHSIPAVKHVRYSITLRTLRDDVH
jgi:alkylated DNA repair dioxygenase AlkB